MTIYLVADFMPDGTAGYRKPYWRVTGMFTSIVRAVAWAGPDSVVTEWSDLDAASEAYRERELPREGPYRIMP